MRAVHGKNPPLCQSVWAGRRRNDCTGVAHFLLGTYVAVRAWKRWKFNQKSETLTRIHPNELLELIQKPDAVTVIDVRPQGMQPAKGLWIPHARRIDLSALAGISLVDFPQGTWNSII